MFRITPILLLAVLLLPLAGTYTAFKIRQYKIHKTIKRQIKRGVKEADLVLLKIHRDYEEKENSRFKRIHSKEFRFDGEMYDIVRQEQQGDTTFYWCVWDKEETTLFADLGKMVQKAMGANPEQKKDSDQLSKFLSSLFFEEQHENYFLLLTSVTSGIHFQFFAKNFIAEIPSPPPETPVVH
jgi:hypothetical protein